MSPTRSLLLACVSGGALVAGTHACSSEAPLPAVVDASDASVDVRVDRTILEPDDGPYASPFEGWEVFHEYDPACGFFVPKSKDYLPPPIRWEPCLSYPETAGKSCRQMVLDWPKSKYSKELIYPATEAFRRSNGTIVLSTARFQADDVYRMLVELDGPTLIAVREHDPNRCVLNSERSDGEHYAFRVLDSEAKGQVSEYGGGAIGGRLDELRPKALKHYHDGATRGFIAGAPGLLEVSGGLMTLSSWTDGSVIKKIWSSAQDNGLAQNYQFFFGETLFWASDSYAINKQKVFTEAGGVKDFLSFGDDTSKGVADLGTDGTDLVWLEGSGRPAPTGAFPQVSAVTAPFTTDPAQVLATRRVLRTDLTGYPFGTVPFVVGCGYAARSTTVAVDGGFASGSELIRLSDGYAWRLPDLVGADWGWRSPLAVTCEELIIKVFQRPAPGEKWRFNVARVRLDSLGPGTPP